MPQPDQELRQYQSQKRFFDEKTDQRHQEIPSTSALVDFIKRMLLSSRVKQTLRYEYAPTLKKNSTSSGATINMKSNSKDNFFKQSNQVKTRTKNGEQKNIINKPLLIATKTNIVQDPSYQTRLKHNQKVSLNDAPKPDI